MNLEETIHMLRWLSNIDARVIFTEPAAEMWAHALAPFEASEAKQAVLDHYRTNDQFPATHAGIRKRALAVRDTREAQQRAINPPKAYKNPMSWRARNPAEWDRLFEEGRRQGNAERARASRSDGARVEGAA